MSNFYYNGEIYLSDESITVEVHAEASGFWKAGDSWGYGCEPPDEDFDIDEVEYLSAKTYDEEGNVSDVEVTDEIKKIVRSELNKVEFKERTSEQEF